MTTYVLAPYVGTGRPGNHIRARVWAPNWTMLIDRRAWGTTQGVALVEADETQLAPGVVTIGTDRFESLGPLARKALARAFRFREVRARTLDAFLVSLGHPSAKPPEREPRRDVLARLWRWWVVPDLAEWYADLGLVPIAGAAALATDNFTGGAQDPLAGNWTTQTGLGSWRRNFPENTANPDFSGDSGANYNAITWPNDQYSQANLTVGTGETAGGGVGLGVAVRCAAAAQTFYRICGDHGASNTFEAMHSKTGSNTSLGFRTTTWTNGQVVYLSATGAATTTITAKMNGVQLGATFTDSSSPITTGRAGMAFSSSLAAGDGTTCFLDDWEGGDISSVTNTDRQTVVGAGTFTPIAPLRVVGVIVNPLTP